MSRHGLIRVAAFRLYYVVDGNKSLYLKYVQYMTACNNNV